MVNVSQILLLGTEWGTHKFCSIPQVQGWLCLCSVTLQSAAFAEMKKVLVRTFCVSLKLSMIVYLKGVELA